MTREHKLSLILGFAVVLVVGVLISDHLSGARKATLETQDPGQLIEHVALQGQARSDLVLFGEDGLPVVSGEPEGQVQSQSGMDWVGGQVAGALRELGQGSSLPSAAQTDDVSADIPTIDMGKAYRESIEPEPDLAQLPPFILHVVRDGESLWSIAQRYLGDGSRYPEIEAINKDRLPSGRALRTGISIRIPDKSKSATSKPARSAKAGTDQESPASPEGESTSYTVKKGDTLSEIAQELLGTIRRMDEIITVNPSKLKSANDLKVGMVLKIPAK